MARILEMRVSLSDADKDAILECAGYGIAYWAQSMEVVDGKLIVIDQEDEGTAYVADVSEMDTAVNNLIRKGQIPDWFLRELREDDVCADADVADSIVQQMLFGEILYG